MTKRKKTPKQKAKEAADNAMSIYIRLKYADWKGYVKCYTCDVVKYYKNGMQNGHFISRASNTLRFEEKNCRPQCVGCNIMKSGNYIEFTMRLIKEKGKAFVDKLREEGKQTYQFTEEELRMIEKKYKDKTKKLPNVQ